MAKITNEKVLEINNQMKILDFLALNMFKEENNGVMEDNNIQEYIKIVINIIRFETDYEMDGLWTAYDNYNNNFEIFIKSFKETGNNEIANYLEKIIELYNLNKSKIENDIAFEEETILDELEIKLREIIEEKDFWGNVSEYIVNKINKEYKIMG
ncbi:MAG: hypothetical protein LBG92_00025 [Prevotellaceae bacterium]|jgi:hypothetical protein|nr:hypothetical protein [Prevotellaceae bacterium]